MDNYLLGQDNTPTPKQLKPINSKLHLEPQWVVTIGATVEQNIYSKLKPIVMNNIMYFTDIQGYIWAINVNTGKIIWKNKINGSFSSGIAIHNGVIVSGTNQSELIAFKQKDGAILWKHKVSSDILAQPLIISNKIVVKTIDGNVYAFDIVHGNKLWRSVHGSPNLVLKVSSAPVAINNQMILVGYSDGKLDAIELNTGNVVWQRSIAYTNGVSDIERLIDIDADPIVHGNVVFIANYQGDVGAFSLDTGEFIWRKSISTYKNMLLYDNMLYIVDSKDIIWAINSQNGQVYWKQTVLKSRNLTEPVIYKQYLFIGDKTGLLHILNSRNGVAVARVAMKNNVNIAPIIYENHVYVITNHELSRYLLKLNGKST